MLSATVSHPTRSPLQPFSSWEHEEQGPLAVAQPGRGVVVYRPPSFEVRHGELGGPVLLGGATGRWPRRVLICVSP